MNREFQLCLLRHAEAVDVGEQGVQRDADRMLTPSGVRQARRAGHALARCGVRPDRVLSSPLSRAVETARYVSEELGAAGPPLEAEELGPEAAPAELWRLVRDHASAGSTLLVVGHLPALDDFTAWLLEAPVGTVHFRKASAALFHVRGSGPRPTAVLAWWLSAGVLKALMD